MSNLAMRRLGKGLPSNNQSQAEGRVTLYNNGTEENPLIASDGRVTYRGWRSGDPQLHLVEGHTIVLLFPGDEPHKVYLANEEDKVSYPEEAVLLVALPLQMGLNSQSAKNIIPRLMAGEAQVMAALAWKENKAADGTSRLQLVGEMAFNDGEIHPITVLDPLPQEIERAAKENRGGYAFWIPLTASMIQSCKESEEESPVQDPLTKKKGTDTQLPKLPANKQKEEAANVPF